MTNMKTLPLLRSIGRGGFREWILGLAAILVFPCLLRAQDPMKTHRTEDSAKAAQAQQASFALTLPDAVQIALKNSLGIQMAKNNISIAGINTSYSFAGGLPSVNATTAAQEQATTLNQPYATASNNKQSNNALSTNLS